MKCKQRECLSTSLLDRRLEFHFFSFLFLSKNELGLGQHKSFLQMVCGENVHFHAICMCYISPSILYVEMCPTFNCVKQIGIINDADRFQIHTRKQQRESKLNLYTLHHINREKKKLLPRKNQFANCPNESYTILLTFSDSMRFED